MPYKPSSSAGNPKLPCPELLAELAIAIPGLGTNDKAFALNLHDYHVKHGAWSSKQAIWAQKMVDKTAAVKLSAPPTVTLGADSAKFVTDITKAAEAAANLAKVMEQTAQTANEMAGVFLFFEHAAAHLKKPAVVISVNGEKIKLKKKEGSPVIYVTNATPGYQNSYYGKMVWSNGNFVWMPKSSMTPAFAATLQQAITEFVADPVAVAAKYGKLTGKCCFCNKALTDEASTKVGYGPVCAKNFHLPWGGMLNNYVAKPFVGMDFGKGESTAVMVTPDGKVHHQPSKFMKPITPEVMKEVAKTPHADTMAMITLMKHILHDEPAAIRPVKVEYLF